MTKPVQNLEIIQTVFMKTFQRSDLKLPMENLQTRKGGSIPWGSGRVMFIFGKESGREYLEYYAHHRIGGDSHAKIFDDGETICLPDLCSMFCYNPELPGDEETQKAEMMREYQKIWEDLQKKGLLNAGPVPASLRINAHLVMNEKRK